MLFNSFSFAIFFPIVFILYWIIPNRFRWILLLTSSYYFYMSWNPKYVFLILLTTVVSYTAARVMEASGKTTVKKLCLTATILVCIGVLFFFKYFNFFSESLTSLLSCFSIKLSPITLKVLLPVGISFYTFQTLSYVIDVYRGKVKAERHFGIYATFISFFPQLVAGPIERTDHLLPQITKEHKFEYADATYGLKLMAWGFFKKMMIADVLSVYVDNVYGNVTGYSGFALILATLLFTVQIYCDFSGYSDIAIGCAKLMDIDLMTNFKSPYFSSSVREFWSRWHISLSTWFKDYVYIPLGGNRVGEIRHKFNLLVTFLVSGLWHGANWTYVIWGALHGVIQIIETAFGAIFKSNKRNQKEGKKQSRFKIALRILFVFAFCSFAWLFFRANTLSDAIYIVKHLFDGITSPVSYIKAGISSLAIPRRARPYMLIALVLLTAFDYCNVKSDAIEKISSWRPVLRWIVYILFAFIAFQIYSMIGVSGASFVYFQF